jgi:hypothetical protein
MALISPGIQVSVTDESQYAPTAAGTIPMLVIASAQDKTSGTGTGTAVGTTKANAEKTYLIGSQRELVSTFGEPTFYKSNSGTALHGNELNEYGLMAAYSLLGVSNRAYIVRADVNTAELKSSSGRPTGVPAAGTYWFDTSKTLFGVQVWNQSTQKFANVVPKVITDSNDIDSSVPKTSFGNIGDYAIDATNTQNPLFYKKANNTWTQVGTTGWQKSFPTIKGTVSSPTLTNGHTIVINGQTVTLSGTTVTALASNIDAEGIPGVTASVVNNKLEIYADTNATSDSSNSGVVVLANGSGSILTDAGLTAGTYNNPTLVIAPHTSVPEFKTNDSTPRPSGSMWIKTTTPNTGANFSISKYNSTTNLFESVTAPLYQNDWSAGEALDKAGNGINIAEGSVYVQYDPADNQRAGYKFFVRHAKGVTTATGTENPTLTASDQFSIRVSDSTGALTSAQTVTLTGATAESFVSDVNALNITNLTCTRDSKTNAITFQHDHGGVIVFAGITGTPLADAGFSTTLDTVKGTADGTGLQVSNWKAFTYSASSTQPTSDPANGALWYNGTFADVDIMIHDGSAWKGYQTVTTDARGFNLSNTDPKGPIVSASEPTAQSDSTALVYGDIWVDTGSLDDHPKIYRWESVDSEDKWVLIDNSDQTTENGILFADFRFHDSATDDVTTSDMTPITTLLSSNYLDLDAPSASLYPKGMLAFNLRRSSGNVKQYKKNYFNATDYAGKVLPTEKNAWVTVSGLQNDGSPFMGRFAQRNVIVAAMKSTLDTSAELREEQRNYNVLAAPGYPEVIQNMVKLNNERRNTGFIVGDTPFRLAPNSTDVQNWATNTKLAVDNNENGLVTADTYLGVFYPSGRTTDLDGNGIVVPPSHMILRTLLRSDEASFPWFAPAGTRRGGVDNATALGYIDSAEGEFKTVGIRESLRDTLYENKINPIAFFPGTGILNFGNKTRHSGASALDRINVARLVAYVRERLGEITKPFIFEPNDKLTRDEIKGVVESLMNDLVAKRGLFDYLVVCDETNNTPDRIDRNELYIDVAIEPVKAVEFIYIPIRIQNTGSISGV